MNYFIIANNKDLQQSTINKVFFNIDNNIIVLFNFLLPLKFKEIFFHKNKICISRKRIIKERQISKLYPNIREYYCNMSGIKYHEKFLTEILFIPCPQNITGYEKEFQDNIDVFDFDKQKISCISVDMKDIRNKLRYTGTGIKSEISTGLLAYYYLQAFIKKPQDKIILVGFTSQLSGYHEAEWEKNYFLDQIYSGKCFVVDSYGITNFG